MLNSTPVTNVPLGCGLLMCSSSTRCRQGDEADGGFGTLWRLLSARVRLLPWPGSGRRTRSAFLLLCTVERWLGGPDSGGDGPEPCGPFPVAFECPFKSQIQLLKFIFNTS